jgi:CHAD domain-containing protein
MAYSLKPNESVGRGLSRVAREQLEAAQDELKKTNPPGDEAVHDARKRVKKVRAILAILDEDDGRGRKGCKKRLQKISRRLSSFRDADAMVEMLGKLKARVPRQLHEQTVRRVRRDLLSRKTALQQAATRHGVWTDLARDLAKVRRQAKRWRPAHRQFQGLAAGIRTAYREGRRAAACAKETETASDFHEWRKEMKKLWYELRLIQEGRPVLAKAVAALHRAESWLGDDHNIVVLCAQLSRNGSLDDAAGLREAARRYQRELRRQVLSSMQRFYARKPGDYIRHVERAWKAR